MWPALILIWAAYINQVQRGIIHALTILMCIDMVFYRRRKSLTTSEGFSASPKKTSEGFSPNTENFCNGNMVHLSTQLLPLWAEKRSKAHGRWTRVEIPTHRGIRISETPTRKRWYIDPVWDQSQSYAKLKLLSRSSIVTNTLLTHDFSFTRHTRRMLIYSLTLFVHRQWRCKQLHQHKIKNTPIYVIFLRIQEGDEGPRF